VIAAPPLLVGTVQDIVARPFAGTPETPGGIVGIVNGVVELVAALAALVPVALVAEIVNVYDVPFVRPVTAHWSGPLLQVQVWFPGLDVTVYEVMVEAP
jgi:hypothetical protein